MDNDGKDASKTNDNTNNVFQLHTREDIKALLKYKAIPEKNLLVPVKNGVLDIRSSNDGKRHIVIKRKAKNDKNKILACDGYFGFASCGNIEDTIWKYKDEINDYFKAQ